MSSVDNGELLKAMDLPPTGVAGSPAALAHQTMVAEATKAQAQAQIAQAHASAAAAKAQAEAMQAQAEAEQAAKGGRRVASSRPAGRPTSRLRPAAGSRHPESLQPYHY